MHSQWNPHGEVTKWGQCDDLLARLGRVLLAGSRPFKAKHRQQRAPSFWCLEDKACKWCEHSVGLGHGRRALWGMMCSHLSLAASYWSPAQSHQESTILYTIPSDCLYSKPRLEESSTPRRVPYICLCICLLPDYPNHRLVECRDFPGFRCTGATPPARLHLCQRGAAPTSPAYFCLGEITSRSKHFLKNWKPSDCFLAKLIFVRCPWKKTNKRLPER